MTTSDSPIVTTVEGPVEGIVENDVFVFKGIPYAKPPEGDLRWKKPADVEPWHGTTRMAKEYGNGSLQNPAVYEAGEGDPAKLGEDCLYLNVWTPKRDPIDQPRLPVMVWIHGGAYILGAGSLPPHIGSPLVNKGAVVVTLNYRLGHLGFFAHPALAGKALNSPVNFGLFDQIAALQWVQRNIEKFGGDPGNVTIFGQSAGAKSVLALFVSPLARGLFHRGVAQSVYGLEEATREQALARGAAFATANNLAGAAATAAELRALPAKDFYTSPTTNMPTAIAGDEVLPTSILTAFKARQQAPVPLIIGSTSDDGSVLADVGPELDPLEIVRQLRANNFPFVLYYPGVTPDAELGRQVCRDLVFTVTGRRFAENHRPVSTVYRFYFDYTAVGLREDVAKHGTRHGDDVIYPFATGDLCLPTKGIFTDADRAFQAKVSEYWFKFASTGTPSADGCAAWLPHKYEGIFMKDRMMHLTETPELKENFMKERLKALVLVLGAIGQPGDEPEAEGEASA